MWRGYDPNWREFIGTTFAVILIEYPDRIPSEVAHDMLTAIDLPIEGEMKKGRLQPLYQHRVDVRLSMGFCRRT